MLVRCSCTVHFRLHFNFSQCWPRMSLGHFCTIMSPLCDVKRSHTLLKSVKLCAKLCFDKFSLKIEEHHFFTQFYLLNKNTSSDLPKQSIKIVLFGKSIIEAFQITLGGVTRLGRRDYELLCMDLETIMGLKDPSWK